MQVLDHRVEVKALEFLGVTERLAHRIGQRGVLMQMMDVECVWPPVTIDPSQNGLMSMASARNRASIFSWHVSPFRRLESQQGFDDSALASIGLPAASK